MGFGDSVGRTADKMLRQVNSKTLAVAEDLFKTIISKTPVGTSETRGQLINNWHVGIGKGNYNRSLNASFQISGIASYNEVAKLRASTEFFRKNGEVSFSNSVSYAFRAEYAGWPAPKWSGRILPGASYGMVRNSLTAVAAKYKV